MKKTSKYILFFAVFFLSFFLVGCEKSTGWTINAMLNNQTKETAYLWIGESNKPNVTDQVAPGQFKMISVHFEGREGDGKAYFDDRLRVHASKDGVNELFKDDPWISNNYEAGKTMYIRWSGTGFKIDY